MARATSCLVVPPGFNLHGPAIVTEEFFFSLRCLAVPNYAAGSAALSRGLAAAAYQLLCRQLPRRLALRARRRQR